MQAGTLPVMPPLQPILYTAARLARQSGMGAAGFLLTAVPILILGLGGVELAHGLFVRQALSHALIEAGRAAMADHAHPDTLAEAFEHALRPLFLKSGSLPRALAQRTRDTGQAPWQIHIVQPHRTAFTDHADPHLRIAEHPIGQRAINHDYQALQHERHLREGWPQGRGPASGQTIFQANTLTLELIWPHEPLTPGIKAIMRALNPADDSYRSRAMAYGYLPIPRSVSLAMQSHPVEWPDRSDGKVIHGEMGNGPGSPPISCTGLWSRCAPLGVRSAPNTNTPVESIGEPGGAGPGHTAGEDGSYTGSGRPIESSGDGGSALSEGGARTDASLGPDC